MAKGWRRTWVRFFVTGWLHGSIRWELEADERGVWADLIVLAGECGREGRIEDNSGKPYPRSFIANGLNIPRELLDRTVAKCQRAGRIDANDEVIIITNWALYQSEYERQKPYRQGKGHKEKTPEQKLDSEYQNALTIAIGDFKRKHGHRPQDQELLKLTDKVRAKYYGEEKTE